MADFTGTPVPTQEYTAKVDAGPLSVGRDWFVEYAKWTHTATEGAGTGEVNLLKLPPGKIEIDSSRSRLKSSQFAANADLHLGHRAYVEPGTSKAVTADDNKFADNLDAGGGALDLALPLPADPVVPFDSITGVAIYALIDTGDIEETDTIELWLAWRYAK